MKLGALVPRVRRWIAWRKYVTFTLLYVARNVNNKLTSIITLSLVPLDMLTSINPLLRILYETFATLINGFSRRIGSLSLKTPYGVYRVLDFEGLFIVSPLFEESVMQIMIRSLVAVCRRRGEVVFIDVGAHVGKYTIAITSILRNLRCKPLIVALEPHPYNFLLLLRNLVASRVRSVISLKLAAFDKTLRVKLYVASFSGRHSVMRGRGAKSHIDVEAKPLNAIVLELKLNRVDLVKIDVEGAEAFVLKGMREILKAYKPYLIIEVSKASGDVLSDLLRRHGYTCYKVMDSRTKTSTDYVFCKPVDLGFN